MTKFVCWLMGTSQGAFVGTLFLLVTMVVFPTALDILMGVFIFVLGVMCTLSYLEESGRL